MKKLIAAGAGAAMLIAAVAPVLAGHHHGMGGGNMAMVTNSAYSYANTGGNYQGNAAEVDFSWVGNVSVSGSNKDLYTGDATSYAGALVVANSDVGCYRCGGGHGYDEESNFAGITNTAYSSAYTGGNTQGNYAGIDHSFTCGNVGVSGNNEDLHSGDADSDSHAWTIVNTRWSL